MPKAALIDVTSRKIKEIEVNTLEDQQKAVGGYIEMAHCIKHDNNHITYFYVDEEGLLKTNEEKIVNGLSINNNIRNQKFFVGNCVIVTFFRYGLDNENIIDLRIPIEEIKGMFDYAVVCK